MRAPAPDDSHTSDKLLGDEKNPREAMVASTKHPTVEDLLVVGGVAYHSNPVVGPDKLVDESPHRDLYRFLRN